MRLTLDVTHVRIGLDVTTMCLTLQDTQVKDHPGLPDHHPGLQLDLDELTEPGARSGK